MNLRERCPKTMIPISRGGQFTSASENQKIAKTEENRLRLIMESKKVGDTFEKERKFDNNAEKSQDSRQLASRKLTMLKYSDMTSDAYRSSARKDTVQEKRLEKVLTEESRVPRRFSRVGVEDVDSWQAQGRLHRFEVTTSLGNIAAHERESSAGAAAAFNPVLAAVATSTARTTTAVRCTTVKNNIDVADRRPWLHLDRVSVLTESSKEDAMEPEAKEEDERRSSTPSPEPYVRRNRCYNEDGSSEEERLESLQNQRLPSSYRGTWPIRRDLWTNQHMNFSQPSTSTTAQNDVTSVMSFSTNSGIMLRSSAETQGRRRLGAKVDVVYSLLAMLGSSEGREDMSTTLLSMSNSIDSCIVMRQSGCLPLLVQLIHAPGQDPNTRERASRALHNVVHAKSDERAGRREARVLRFLEQLRDYCQALRMSLETGHIPEDLERHPGPTIAALMKLSFDEAHRHAMCQLGGLHAVAELIEMDHLAHGSECDDQNCITLRRYAGMALTNLTFGDGNNKALLCSFRAFMKALVSQLRSPSDDLRQVTASVLRNLSWRADSSSKQTLREVGVVTGLMRAAMEGRKESTLKSILSALWNLSAHCTTNKTNICAVEGALAFIVDMLSYRAPSRTLAIVENAGGILRNISSHIAVRDDYRAIIRERGCLQVLLQQLRSPSLTVVSNACGALWNLSARCPQDKRLLWDLGAVPMLRSLVNSRHKMISMGSSAALKNLLSERPDYSNIISLDTTARELGLPSLPTLYARKQRALEQEIDQNLAETCDNIEPSTSPTNKDHRFTFKLDHSFFDINLRALHSYAAHDQPNTSGIKYNGVARSESRDSMRSVTSTHSDTIFERVNRHMLNGTSPTDVQIKQQSSSLHGAVGFDTATAKDNHHSKAASQKKYTLRYKNAVSERLKSSDAFNNTNDLKCTNSTMSWSSGADKDSACSQTLLHSSMEENLSLMNQSISSTSKTGSQSSISETAETTVSRQKQPVKCTIGTSKALTSYAQEKSPTKKGVTYNNMYVEKSLLHPHAPLTSIQKVISPINHNHNSSDNLFSDYAETDLDQPTDYSLRYAERTSEDDEKQDSAYFANTEQVLVHEDTIKTYYTERTPLETPLNSSRATSASDLQEDSGIKNTAKRLLKQSNLITNKVQTYHQAQFMETEKLNNFQDPKENLKLQHIVQVPEKKKTTSSYPVSDIKVIESEQIENNKKYQLSIKKKSDTKTETAQEIISNLQYTGDSNVNPNVVTTISDMPARFESEGVLLENDYKLNKILPKGIEVYTENIISKGSNDSGYQISDGDEDDEDLLAACINIGMQNNRHRHSFIGNSFEKLSRTESNLTRYQTSVALDQMESSEIADSTVTSYNIKQTESNEEISIVSPEMIKSSNINVREEETQRKQCVEPSLSSKTDIEIEDEIVLQFSQEYPMDEIKDIGEVKNYPYFNLPSNISFDNLEDRIASSGECMAQQCVSIDAEWEDNIVIDDKISDNLTAEKQPYAKVMDSESSESIDSVERSEHALLELCLQPTLSKSDESILPDKCRQDYDESSIETRKDTDFTGQELIMNEKDFDKTSSNSEQMSNNSVTKVKNSVEKYAEEEVYRRQRDPDAMIASLDRLTATLVQQTEAMRERNDSTAMKQSTISDTWTEDSPNEVSFPSISISAPLIASFKSDIQEDQASESVAETESNEQMNMTNSKIIQQEAIKLARAVDAEANKQSELEISSITSIDLDAIKPPSSMGSLISLTASYAGPTDSNEAFINRDRCYSTSLPPVQTKNVWVTDSRNCHKKSLPLGVVAKRALGQGQSHMGSLENLLNECTNSHLENVKPPSMMDELLDMGDMENSMLSVASITSEIADSKEHDSHSLTGSDPVFDLLKPVANVLSITCMRYAEAMQVSANNSLSECLENINPPSLFNEVSEMDESTMEPTTDTLCSDTLCIDAELKTEEAPHPIIIEKIDETGNDTDEAATPISSEYCVSSSAESTPKKKLNRNHLTPKQKRTLAKERYKTYTIAAEMVRKEEEERGKQENTGEQINKISRGKCSPFSKLTPKQRRQEDRARFQTQVLENPFPDLTADQTSKNEVESSSVQENTEKSDVVSPTKSGIPTFTKLFACRGSRKKRLENQETKERYRTRTLNDSESILKDIECNHVSDVSVTAEEKQERMHGIRPEEIQTILEQNATIVLNTLNESSKATDSTGEDLLLDCETLSLISNESESEKNIKIRFVNGLSKKLLSTCMIQTSNAEASIQAFEEQKETGDTEIVKPHEELGTDVAESGNESECTEEQVEETKRPRIIKPGTISRDLSADSNMTDKSEPESPKAIRGRRKALYSNPITRKSTPQSSPLKQVNPISGIPIGRSNTSPIVRATRATTLRQNNNSPNFVPKDPLKSNSSNSLKTTSPSIDNERKIKNVAVTSKRASVPQKGSPSVFNKSTKRHSTPPTCSSNYQNESKSETLIKPLERQGTFTKDEPEVENAPTVLSSTSPIRTKIAKPLKSTMSKAHPVGGKSKISVRTHQVYQSKITKTNSTEKIQPPKALPLLIAPKRLPSGKLIGPGKVSTNNQNTLQNDGSKTFRKVGPLGQRSNSNSSILSNSSMGTQSRKPVKEATSKIAGLWKKVEEKKNKQHLEKSEMKPWITSDDGSNETDAAASLDEPPAFKLFRSSTFEGVSQDNNHNQRLYKSKFKRPPVAGGIYVNAMKYRNSCDLSGMSGNDITSKGSSTKPSESVKKEVVQTEDNSVVLRKQQSSEIPAGTEVDSSKRISRLGSFIRVDSTNSESSQTHVSANGTRTPMASAIVPPFNYNPKQDIPLQANKIRLDGAEERFEATDYPTKMITTSTKVTTV